MASVVKKDWEASYSAPAMVLPKEAMMRLVLMMEEVQGKVLQPIDGASCQRGRGGTHRRHNTTA